VSSASGSEGYSPYFFLSYARTPWNDPGGPNPDYWARRFYRELCNEILQHTSLPHGFRPGFMDVDLEAGVEWDQRLARELATCRVFVPLYSRRYFQSVQCGKEWAAFDLRRRSYMNGRNDLLEVIVPAYWVPVPDYEIPDIAKPIQYTHPDLGPYYQEHGLYAMMKIRRFRDHYKMAVYALARRIIDVAERVRLPHGEPVDYSAIKSAFTRDPERRFQITVVAGTVDTLPQGRAADCYGPTVMDWNPYHPESSRPLVEFAAEIVRELDFEPEIGSWTDHRQELAENRAPSCPGLVLLDPWALLDARYEELLYGLNWANNPWIGVIVPWSRTDPQIAERATVLRERLREVLPSKIAHARPSVRRAVDGVPTIGDFEMALRPLLQTLANSYLRNVQAVPPHTPGNGFRRLWGKDDPPKREGPR